MHLIHSRTPFRISFFGGGSDYPVWYRQHGGAVLSTSINRYCYISCRYLPPFFGCRHRIVWSHIETVNSIGEILHPAVRVGLPMMGFDDSQGVELMHQGDLPARTGIGSSSTFAVGLLNALAALRGELLDRHQLALRAIDLEQNRLRDNVGSQDQIAAAYGGLNVIRFGRDDTISVQPMDIPQARRDALEARLLMFYTGMSRLSSNLAGKLIENLVSKACDAQIHAMTRMVEEAAQALHDDKLDDFGRMLHDAWLLKRSLTSAVSNDRIDGAYARALDAGALGGKLIGAGETGFMIFYAPPERHGDIRAALHDMVYVPFGFDTTGSQIIYCA
jgi:D-glycero-alpha-D-manno-heptose-7-phosphate kinase